MRGARGRGGEPRASLPPVRDRLLFVGLNPSPVSVAAGHYHQGRLRRSLLRRLKAAGRHPPHPRARLGRSFWRRLKTAGLIPPATELEWADDALIAAGHGITDLIKVPTPRDEASDAALRAGVGALWQKIAIWRPAAVVFIYKRGATISAGRQLTESWGQLEGVALAGRPCFLMPGPYAPTEQVHEGLNFLRNLAAALPAKRD